MGPSFSPKRWRACSVDTRSVVGTYLRRGPIRGGLLQSSFAAFSTVFLSLLASSGGSLPPQPEALRGNLCRPFPQAAFIWRSFLNPTPTGHPLSFVDAATLWVIAVAAATPLLLLLPPPPLLLLLLSPAWIVLTQPDTTQHRTTNQQTARDTS